MIIGDRIKIEREAQVRNGKQMTQTDLAGEIGISREAVSQWESGSTKSIRPVNLLNCAIALNCSIVWLISGKEYTDYPHSVTFGRKDNTGSPTEPQTELEYKGVRYALHHLDSIRKNIEFKDYLGDEYITNVFIHLYSAYFNDETRALSTRAHLQLVPKRMKG